MVVPPEDGIGFRELFRICEGIYVTINNFIPREDWTFGLEGEDALIAHFQISGGSQSTFHNSDPNYEKHFRFTGSLAAVAFHPKDISEKETFVAGSKETSVTINCTLSALEKRFNIRAKDFSPHIQHQVYDSPNKFFCESIRPMPYMREDTERLIRLEAFGKHRAMYIEGLTLNLLSNLLGASIKNPDHNNKVSGRDRNAVERVREVLKTNFTKPPSIPDLAKSVGLNRNKLNFCFQNVYGQTVSDYCTSLRMEKSSQLLLETNMNITDVALQVGYRHPTSFSAAFLRNKGMSPRDYRNNN